MKFYEYNLKRNDRLTIIRFCLNYGNRLKLSTRGEVLRFVSHEMLEEAFKEDDEQIKRQINEYQKILNDYKNGKGLEDEYIRYFGKKPTVEKVENYVKDIIKQEENSSKRRYHHITVNAMRSKEVMDFHNKINPRVTFGYSSQLKEECDTIITDELKEILLKSMYDKEEEEWEKVTPEEWSELNLRSYGEFELKIEVEDSESDYIYYEDLEIYLDDRLLISTISHESMFDIYFTEEDLEMFKNFEGYTKYNEEIIKRLLDSSSE